MREVITEAIQGNFVLSLKYQKNPRKVIPLTYGMLKNGMEALLCYKINFVDQDGPSLSIRVYHSHKISDVVITETKYPFSKKIDYYLTKHFRDIYIQV